MEVDTLKEEEEELLLSQTDEDTLMKEADLKDGEVEQLLASEEQEFSQEEEQQQQEEEKKSDGSQKSYTNSYRGNGRGGNGRFFRGGLMGRMPPPGRFFGPPFGPPMRRMPPFGLPFRHPLGMRGPPRHPMMGGGPIIPPPHIMRGMMRPRPFFNGPPRPLATPMANNSSSSSSAASSSNSNSSSSKEPTPLMSIETPLTVKQKVEQKLQYERAQALAQRQQRNVMSLKRNSSHLNYTSEPKPAKIMHHSSYQPQPSQQPQQQPMQVQQSSSTVMRSNLRQIQCVDQSAESTRRQQPTNFSPNLKTLTPHQPGSALRTINTTQPTHNGNLRTIPLVGEDTTQRPQTNRIRVTNLPLNFTFDRISQMTTFCGNVKTIQMESGYANIEFSNALSAEKFQRMYHKKILDNCLLSVSKVF